VIIITVGVNKVESVNKFINLGRALTSTMMFSLQIWMDSRLSLPKTTLTPVNRAVSFSLRA